MLITPPNGTATQNVGLINCQWIYKKSYEISEVLKDLDLDVLWLIGNVSGQKFVCDVTPAG